MKQVAPSLKTTEHSPDLREWVPSTFTNFLLELEHIRRHCDADDPCILFRGHANAGWRLDCTLVRSLLRKEYSATPDKHRPLSFHTYVVDTLLTKFGKYCRPSQEALAKEKSHNIDPWYELMKKFQQYSDADIHPKGTFMIDWTLDSDIALFFATFQGQKGKLCPRQTEGAIWVCDPIPTGKVLQTKTVAELMSLMRQDEFRLQAQRTLPLILHPQKQTRMARAMHQQPVYFSQMNFTSDLADAWAAVEMQNGATVYKTLILTKSLIQDSIAYLASKGITEEYVYPD